MIRMQTYTLVLRKYRYNTTTLAPKSFCLWRWLVRERGARLTRAITAPRARDSWCWGEFRREELVSQHFGEETGSQILISC